MTNEEYIIALKPKVNALIELRNKAKQLAAGIIGQNLTKDDLFFCASTDRCMRLIDGFIPMLQNRNLTCAGVLLRMQMDNCMRTYAAYIAQDQRAVVRSVVNGVSIRKLKDKNGKNMTDTYLKEQLTNIDPCFSEIYGNACGYVHLSEKAFYQTVVNCKDFHLDFGIGTPLPEKRNTTLLECADAYIRFVLLHFNLLQPVVDSKRRFDAEHTE